MLLVTSETALEAEVRDALRIRQQEREPVLFFELTYVDPALLFDFWGVLDLLDHVRSDYFDMVHIVPSAATWSHSRHSDHSGQPPLRSRSSPLGLPSLSPDETRKSTRPIERWKLQFGSRSRPSNAHLKSLVSMSFSPKTLEDTVYMVPLPYGYYGSFVFLRAYATLGVQVATCASSRERTTSVRLEFSPTVSIFETVCPWVGLLSNKSKTDLCTRAPFLFVARAAMRIPPSLVSRKTPRFVLRRLLSLVQVSGAHVSTTIHWKGDSVPLGMAINLISLLWASLHSSHRLWHPVLLLCGLRTKRGKRVLCRDRRSQISSPQTLLQPICPSLLVCLPLARLCAPC